MEDSHPSNAIFVEIPDMLAVFSSIFTFPSSNHSKTTIAKEKFVPINSTEHLAHEANNNLSDSQTVPSNAIYLPEMPNVLSAMSAVFKFAKVKDKKKKEKLALLKHKTISIDYTVPSNAIYMPDGLDAIMSALFGLSKPKTETLTPTKTQIKDMKLSPNTMNRHKKRKRRTVAINAFRTEMNTESLANIKSQESPVSIQASLTTEALYSSTQSNTHNKPVSSSDNSVLKNKPILPSDAGTALSEDTATFLDRETSIISELPKLTEISKGADDDLKVRLKDKPYVCGIISKARTILQYLIAHCQELLHILDILLNTFLHV